MLANLTDPTGGDAMDRIINGLSKVAPKALTGSNGSGRRRGPGRAPPESPSSSRARALAARGA